MSDLNKRKMRKPSKKYFTADAGITSLLVIRKWLADGATPVDIARWVTSEYAKAESDESRFHLGMMLCSVYDSGECVRAGDVARKCADMFNVRLLRGRTISESAMAEMLRCNNIGGLCWLDRFNPYFENHCRKIATAQIPAWIKLKLSEHDCENLICVDEKRFIYALRGLDGKLWLIGFNNCNTDILIDEELFNDEPPLYFTESTHFTSPLWLINRVADILEYLLRRIGYPCMKIHKKMVFPSDHACLINYDEYVDCSEWRGVEAITWTEAKGNPLVPLSLPIKRGDIGITNMNMEFNDTLYLCLMATKEIIESFNIYSVNKPGDNDIETWCKKRCIFDNIAE